MMKVKNLTLWLIVFVFQIYSLKATSAFDSIYKACKQANKQDTLIIKCLDYKSFEIASTNPGLGLKLGFAALKLAKDIQWEKGIALASNEIAINYSHQSNYDSSIYYYIQALNLFKRLGNIHAQYSVMTNLSQNYKSKGNYPKALDLLNQAFLLIDNTQEFQTKGIILENIGTVYLELKDFKKAQNYYLKARMIYLQKNDSSSLARNMLNLGIIYDKNKDYKNALKNLQEALEINLKLKNKHSIQINYANLAIVYKHLSDFDNAVQCHKKAIQLAESIENENALAIEYGNLGEVYLDLFHLNHLNSDLKAAINYLKKAYFLCDKIGFTPPQVEFSEKLVEALELEGKDYKLAFQVLKKGSQLKDSIFSIDNSLKIHQLESEKMLAIKDKEIRISRLKGELAQEESLMHQHQKTILFLIILVCGLVMVVLYLLYLNRNRVFNLKMKEISQIQSHEVRAPVARIMAVLEVLNIEKLNSEEKDEMLKILKNSIDELDDKIHKIIEITKQ